MSEKSSIQWTDATWNPTRGCSRHSPGCINCYAEIMAARFSDPGMWGHGFAHMVGGDHRFTGKVELIEKQLTLPLRWRAPRKIFVNSTSDLFHEKLPQDDIVRVFAVMAVTQHHTYQILTKRAARMSILMQSADFPKLIAEYVDGLYTDGKVKKTFDVNPLGISEGLRGGWRWPLHNVWLGVSVENQQYADERIPLLLKTPAAVRFISAEPLLERLELHRYIASLWCPEHGEIFSDADHHADYPDCPFNLETASQAHGHPRLDMVIVGGESGPGAREFKLSWAETIIAQCRAAGVACFVKQIGANAYDDISYEGATPRFKTHDGHGGEPLEWPKHLRVREFPRIPAHG